MTEAILQVSDLSVYYNQKALNSVSLSFQSKENHSLDWSIWIREINPPQGYQPHGGSQSRGDYNWFGGLQRPQHLQPTYRYS